MRIPAIAISALALVACSSSVTISNEGPREAAAANRSSGSDSLQSADAENLRAIPRSIQIDSIYLSDLLKLKPCISPQELSSQHEEAALSQAIASRQALPAGSCDDPRLAEKLFKARFLQHASLRKVVDPWKLDSIIKKQNQAIRHCQDKFCLQGELDKIINALLPIYSTATPSWPTRAKLCPVGSLDVSASTALDLLKSKTRESIIDGCGGERIVAQTCNGPVGKFLFLTCEMEGNQVNAPEWLGRITDNRLELLLAAEDGPLGVLEGTCNGMPDLKTSARIGAGENYVTFYRYDGGQYRSVYSYSQTVVGQDQEGNDLSIASGDLDVPVTCH